MHLQHSLGSGQHAQVHLRLGQLGVFLQAGSAATATAGGAWNATEMLTLRCRSGRFRAAGLGGRHPALQRAPNRFHSDLAEVWRQPVADVYRPVHEVGHSIGHGVRAPQGQHHSAALPAKSVWGWVRRLRRSMQSTTLQCCTSCAGGWLCVCCSCLSLHMLPMQARACPTRPPVQGNDVGCGTQRRIGKADVNKVIGWDACHLCKQAGEHGRCELAVLPQLGGRSVWWHSLLSACLQGKLLRSTACTAMPCKPSAARVAVTPLIHEPTCCAAT